MCTCCCQPTKTVFFTMLSAVWFLTVSFVIFGVKSSLYFSGGIKYGVIPNSTLIDEIGSGDFTIQAWFSIDGNSQFGEFSSILCSSTSNSNGFIFGVSSINGDAAPWFKLSENYVTDCCLHYDDGNWHHFIVVKNSTHIQFYIDGQSKYINNNMYVYNMFHNYTFTSSFLFVSIALALYFAVLLIALCKY